MLSILTATRRPEEYLNMVQRVESAMGDLITEYIAFVNNDNVKDEFRHINKDHEKITVMFAPENFLYKQGFDTVYNTLMKRAKSEYVCMIFDADTIEINYEQFVKDLAEKKDAYTFQMYMERGNVWEKKLQLYKNDNLLKWFGLVHENQMFQRQPEVKDIDSLKILHYNARDEKSKNLHYKDNFIILERTEEGTDSDRRNLLYEGLAWKIVNENGRHMNKAWFEKHYTINKDVIDWYHERAEKIWA